MSPFNRSAIAAVLVVELAGCASWPRSVGARPCCLATTKPVVTRQPIWWHLFDVTVTAQIEQAFHLVRVGRKLLGVPVRASNLRGGELAESTVFTERDPARLSTEEVRWGPTPPGDLPQPPMVITKPKVEGKTPGFFAEDARGRTYLLKLDPLDAPELLSGAEVVTSKLLYALGYHVPSYEVLSLAPDELHVGPGMTTRSRRGQPVPFADRDLRAIVEPRLRDGHLRVAASKFLEGEMLGSIPFKRFKDCAEIRTLKVVYAWVNNIDSKDHNSLLVWDGEKTVGYLIDFGTSLGAHAGRAGSKQRCEGWLHVVDLKEASLRLLTLGTHRPTCDPSEEPFSPSIGLFSSHVDPERWRPYAPNLAFEEMTREDARWMARRMARLSREQIQAAVSAGQYTHPSDAAYLVDVLIARRDAIVRRYLNISQPQEVAHR